MSHSKMVCVVLTAVLWLVALVNSTLATDYVRVVKRGNYVSQALSPGDTLTVYYKPDGTNPTFSAQQAPVYYWANAGSGGGLNSLQGSGANVPFVVLNKYIWGPRVGWQWLWPQTEVTGNQQNY